MDYASANGRSVNVEYAANNVKYADRWNRHFSSVPAFFAKCAAVVVLHKNFRSLLQSSIHAHECFIYLLEVVVSDASGNFSISPSLISINGGIIVVDGPAKLIELQIDIAPRDSRNANQGFLLNAWP